MIFYPLENGRSQGGRQNFLTHFGLVSAQYFDQKKRLAVALEPRSSSQTAHAEGSHGRVTAERLPPRPALPWPGAAVKAPAGLALAVWTFSSWAACFSNAFGSSLAPQTAIQP